MALKSGAPFPIFPPNVSIPHRRSSIPTEIRFSRWNNANAEPFVRRQRRQKEIEDDLRRHRRYDSATKIVEGFDAAERTSTASSSPLEQEYKSTGTRSAPSSPSIPGKFSKYSKPPKSPSVSHPAFRRIARAAPKSRVPPPAPDGESGILFSDKGISYKLKDAPFEFQYSYTETPKVKPLALREPPFLPFGPTTMPRPWTGRAPIAPSKKKLPEFDSFRLPPAGKKGVKTVQSPGPFLAGSGPKYTASTREEILGEPLTLEEIKALIQGCLKCKRQLNMGRDGFTHNMLDNIHAHWKRRRVCKIKCKGVCTVDMDNVRQQLEEKTGGKIIGGKGGVIFLYRGRNYNYRTRPRFPLMLWKPITPVYPRLVPRAPEGLTLEEAKEMRKKGRLLPPICKLGKNGLYANLVKHVQEAFEECELVRINCNGLNKSDCRKIGAKLRDLVPCVLVSFEYEHILMWRGKDWKSSLASSQDGCSEATEQVTGVSSDTTACDESVEEDMNPTEDFGTENSSGIQKMDTTEVEPTALSINAVVTENFESSATINQELPSSSSSDGTVHSIVESGSAALHGKDMVDTYLPWMEEVRLLVKQAVEEGSAEVLEEEYLDADTVLERSIALAKRAPVGPTFQHLSKKATTQRAKKEKNESIEEKIEEKDDVVEALVVSQEGDGKRKSRSRKTERTFLDVVPHGTLRVDELAKLLA